MYILAIPLLFLNGIICGLLLGFKGQVKKT